MIKEKISPYICPGLLNEHSLFRDLIYKREFEKCRILFPELIIKDDCPYDKLSEVVFRKEINTLLQRLFVIYPEMNCEGFLNTRERKFVTPKYQFIFAVIWLYIKQGEFTFYHRLSDRKMTITNLNSEKSINSKGVTVIRILSEAIQRKRQLVYNSITSVTNWMMYDKSIEPEIKYLVEDFENVLGY